jgi:type III secretion protein R
MKNLHFFSLKTLILSAFLLFLLSLVPESLYSQRATPLSENQERAAESLRSAVQSSTNQPAPAKARQIDQSAPENNAPATGNIASNLNVSRPSLITQTLMLALMSLLPFLVMILSSFLKIVVVLSLLRTALGVQQAPPNQVINGVAFLLSLFIMYPTGIKMYQAAQSRMEQVSVPESLMSTGSSTYVIEVAKAAGGPMREFLKKNSLSRHQILFYRLVYRGLPEEFRENLKPDDFIVLVPSFITGQLKDAFEIGVLIYIPFFVIDLVTSNILLAMGMMMLSPVTISMPLKLFLLVMLDGWTILIEGLVKTFQ